MTICLSLIVKNEAHVIKRCLDSVRPLIDCWCIVDTGSTDGTQSVIRDLMHDVPGDLFERQWIDFAHNRTEALALARDKADYTLIIDADDLMVIPPDFKLPELTADSYTVDFDFPPLHYRRVQLVRNTIKWRYRGVLHEFLEGDGARPHEHLPITIKVTNDGARRQDPDKYRKDAATLEKAIQTERDPFMLSRYTFYLAQSWRDCGEREKALTEYLARSRMGFWQEEVYISLLNAARIRQALQRGRIIDTFLDAARAAPTRGEALHAAANLLRQASRFEEGYQAARRGVGLPVPADGLFVEPWVHEYGLLDELAVNAYWAGHYRECVDACEVLLSEGKIADRARVTMNLNFARRKLLEG